MVGAGAAIYSNKQLIKQCKHKLCSYYPTNEAEQIVILKALEQLQTWKHLQVGKQQSTQTARP